MSVSVSLVPACLRPLRLALPIVLVGVLPAELRAGVAVNSALPITNEVHVQPIITKHSDGSVATFFGSPAVEAYVKGEIDAIWAQCGVAVRWLEPTEYQSDFAYDGSPRTYTNKRRPSTDLRAIVDGAETPPKSASAAVVNMFFVEVVPGFEKLPDNYANGLAFLDANGIAVHVGKDLLGWNGGRDVVARVVAHELGHNLGLSHVSGGGNLMSSQNGTGQLTSAQTATIFTDHGGVDGFDFLQSYGDPTNYARWEVAHALTTGPFDDEDGDHLANILEFMLGLDPKVPSRLPAPIWSTEGLTWTLPKTAAALEDGLTLSLEVSESGASWFPAGALNSTILADDDSQLSLRLGAGLEACFMRAQVETPTDFQTSAATVLPADFGQPDGQRRIATCSTSGCGCATSHLP